MGDLISAPAALLGLTAAGDIGGALGNLAQQRRQRAIFQQAMDPNQIASQAQVYANPLFRVMGPQIAEQTGGVLGERGVTQGAYGAKIMEKALADAYAQMYNQGASNYLSRLQIGQGAIGPGFPIGQSQQALQQLMILNALRSRQGQRQDETGGNVYEGSLGGGSYTGTPNPYNLNLGDTTLYQGMLRPNPQYMAGGDLPSF